MVYKLLCEKWYHILYMFYALSYSKFVVTNYKLQIGKYIKHV